MGNQTLNGKAIESELLDRIKHVYGPVWQSGDAKKFVAELFSKDAVVTASNDSTTWSGAAQIEEVISQLIGQIKDLHPTVIWTRPISPVAAAQFVTYRIEARDPERQGEYGDVAKALYSWEKTSAGWRVVADLSAYVGMDVPG